MEKLHNELRSKHAWYDKWHAESGTNIIAWGLFVCVAVFSTSAILESIQSTMALIDANSQLGAVGASVEKRQIVEDAKVARVRELTNQALVRAEQHPRGASADTQASIQELKRILSERKTAITEAAKTDPQSLSGILFNETAVASFPAEVQSLLEKPFKKTGRYMMYIVSTDFLGEDVEDGFLTGEEGYEEYFLEVNDEERYQLFLTQDQAYQIDSGTGATVTGADIGNGIVIPTAPFEETEWDGEEGVLGASTIKKIAVVPILFSNSTAITSLTPEIIKSRIFTGASSVNAYYKDASYGFLNIQGKTSIDGDVFAWTTIPYVAAGVCEYSLWASQALQVLASQGKDMSGYTNIQFIFPSTSSGCGWAGLGQTVSSINYTSALKSWVRSDYVTTQVAGHELGHNFGFHHAASYGCPVAKNTSPASCTSSEYGDPYDIMGSASVKHTNGFNKAKSAWTDSSQMLTVAQSGTYTIEPVEMQTAGTKYIRIKRPFTSSLGTYSDGYYLIEQRANVGTFGNYGATSPAVAGVAIRLVGDSVAGGARKTFFVRNLLPGETFTDAEAGITLALASFSTTSASVQVTKAGPACVRNNPTVTVSPVSTWVAPGALSSYSVTVLNNDGEGCSSASFTVTAGIPTGFTQTPTTLTISDVASLASKTGTISILSPLDVVVGAYAIPLTVQNTGSGALVQSMVNYNVVPADTTAPVATITAPLNGSIISGGKNVSVASKASDASGIYQTDISIDGKSVKTCSVGVTDCAYSWSQRKVTAGTHTIMTTVTDNSANRNKSTASIVVTK